MAAKDDYADSDSGANKNVMLIISCEFCCLPFKRGGDDDNPVGHSDITSDFKFETDVEIISDADDRSFFQLMLGHQCSEPESFQASFVFSD